MSEQFPQPGTTGLIQSAPKMYLYQQYSDDDNLQAFVASFNAIVQTYMGAFSSYSSITMLGAYTSTAIYGPLLDWIGTSIYGIARPNIAAVLIGHGEYDSVPWNTTAWSTLDNVSAFITDDQYKRILTWYLYRGDGLQMSMSWLRRRIARFLYGTFGSDIDVGLVSNVNLTISGSAITITIPSSKISEVFHTLISRGLLPLPFQMTYSVVIS